MRILKEIAGITVGTIAIITALLWILILSGQFDIETMLAKPVQAPKDFRIIAGGPETTTGFGYWDRKKERGR